MQRFPKNVRQMLQVSTAELDETALLTDKMVDVDRDEVSAISQQCPSIAEPKPSNFESGSMLKMFKKFPLEPSELRKRFDDQQNNRSRLRSYSRSRAAGRSSSVNRDFYWDHRRFGVNSKKFVDPCKYKDEKN